LDCLSSSSPGTAFSPRPQQWRAGRCRRPWRTHSSLRARGLSFGGFSRRVVFAPRLLLLQLQPGLPTFPHSTRLLPLPLPARPLAHRLDSSRPRPISCIRSPRRNPEAGGDCAQSSTTWSPASSRPSPARRPPSAAPVSLRPSLLSYFATGHFARRRAPPQH